jgi:hypothetical protein
MIYFNIVLQSSLRISKWSLQVFRFKCSIQFLVSTMCATWLAHHIIINLITLTISDEQNYSRILLKTKSIGIFFQVRAQHVHVSFGWRQNNFKRTNEKMCTYHLYGKFVYTNQLVRFETSVNTHSRRAKP